MDHIYGFKKMWKGADFILNLEAATETQDNKNKLKNSQQKAFGQAKNTIGSTLHRLIIALITTKTLCSP